MVSSCCKWHNDFLINTYFCLCTWRIISKHFQFRPTSFILYIVVLILRLSKMYWLKATYKLQSVFPSLDESLQDDNLLASQRRRLVLARKAATHPVSISQICWVVLVDYTVGFQEGYLHFDLWNCYITHYNWLHK